MTLPELHALLGRLGIVLSARGDRLHWAAPPGAMTPEVKDALATHKPALLRLLSAPGPAGPPTNALDQVVDRIARRRNVPIVEVDGGRIVEPDPAGLPEGAADPGPPPWPPRPAELADWPVEWRQRWGRLANEMQDQGIPWPEHERAAFERIKAERDTATGARPAEPLSAPR